MLAAHVRSLDGPGPLDNLGVGELPDPVVRPGWSLVRVEAAGLNHHDLFTLRGRSSAPVVPPQILGCDAAGVVVAHGDTNPEDRPDGTPAVGDAIVGHSVIHCGRCGPCLSGDLLLCRRLSLISEGSHPGALAEFVLLPTANLIARPPELDAVSAACLPTAYLTAFRMLFTKAALSPGATVLIQGASGGVATAAILLCRATGIRVIASSRDEAKRAGALQMGADHAVPSARGAHREVLALTEGVGVDAVIETVGEPTWDMSLRSLRSGGVVVVAGATAGGDPPAQLARVFWRQLSILGSTMGTRSELVALIHLVARGAVRPLVDRTYPLAEAAAAFAHLQAGEMTGKIVITPGSSAIAQPPVP